MADINCAGHIEIVICRTDVKKNNRQFFFGQIFHRIGKTLTVAPLTVDSAICAERQNNRIDGDI